LVDWGKTDPATRIHIKHLLKTLKQLRRISSRQLRNIYTQLALIHLFLLPIIDLF
jgi:hypothetical protein